MSEVDQEAEAALREIEEEEQKEVATLKRSRDAQKTCPQCKVEYTPDFPESRRGSACTPIQREQHVTGICSDACWDAFLGVKTHRMSSPGPLVEVAQMRQEVEKREEEEGAKKKEKSEEGEDEEECPSTPVLRVDSDTVKEVDAVQ